jgi:hypothetical protein
MSFAGQTAPGTSLPGSAPSSHSAQDETKGDSEPFGVPEGGGRNVGFLLGRALKTRREVRRRERPFLTEIRDHLSEPDHEAKAKDRSPKNETNAT